MQAVTTKEIGDIVKCPICGVECQNAEGCAHLVAVVPATAVKPGGASYVYLFQPDGGAVEIDADSLLPAEEPIYTSSIGAE